MYSANEINKIYTSSNITLKNINITTLLFNDSKAISKKTYAITDDYINVKDPITISLSLLYNVNSCDYYEFNSRLDGSTIISGLDIFGNTLNIANKTLLVFVDGYKLLQDELDIDEDNNTITIHQNSSNKIVNIIIYASNKITYLGKVTDNTTYFTSRNISLENYTDSSYIFFKNGELITHDKIKKTNDYVTLNIEIREGVDIVEYFQLPLESQVLLFAEEPGYFSYGPKDNYGILVPEIYDTVITFDKIVRLAIDDVRKGFFIREDSSLGSGLLMLIDNDFETYDAKCIKLQNFSKQLYTKNEYYLQVPQAKSILKYVSEFDLKGKLFPELLGIFQKLLLDETYDSVQRLKNIRSINNVDSQEINKLISFLGLNINIKNISIEQKHALLEELTNFYRIVGTKASYNFYNILSTNAHIVDLEQLFTPIRDYSDHEDSAKRYVDFRTPEELGGVYKRKYEIPQEDYGYVDEIANPGESFSNTPSDPGILENLEIGTVNFVDQQYYASSLRNVRDVYINQEDIILDENDYSIEIPVTLNRFIKEPEMGPNVPTIDYGWINEEPENWYDYGSVSEAIKGKWVEWLEWDRPSRWYPTNHVNVSLEIPANVDYSTFINEFKSTFYEIASTVLYIHRIIEVYNFGNNTDSKGEFSILTAPVFEQIEHTFTNDPARQV